MPLVAMGTAVFSFVLVGAVRRIAIHRNLMDLPNERSSHSVATPRGGGVGIVLAFIASMTALSALDLVSNRNWFAFVLSGSSIALVGFLDDRHHLSARIRFTVHIGAAISFVLVSGGYPDSELARWGMSSTWVVFTFSVLTLVWGTNLFNFMDGIDGIAACESIFIAAAGGFLNYVIGGDLGITGVLFGLSAASLGFVFWNWPPAKIFMGDVGSGFLGFLVSAILMAGSNRGPLPIEVLPILGGVFFVDATITLFRRILQRDRWLDAHRTHAYQHLARRLGRHKPVTVGTIGINLFWLFPWAFAVVRRPANGPMFTLAALLPLVILSIAVGAGRRETKVY
jgi:Fuc2NAc and GlcNAc transferase